MKAHGQFFWEVDARGCAKYIMVGDVSRRAVGAVIDLGGGEYWAGVGRVSSRFRKESEAKKYVERYAVSNEFYNEQEQPPPLLQTKPAIQLPLCGKPNLRLKT